MSRETLLLVYAAVSVAALVLLVVRVKLSAFLALIIASVMVGLAAGMTPLAVLKAFQDGVGGVLASIAMILGLGTIIGTMLARSGGAEVVASHLINFAGVKQLPAAFCVLALIAGLPVFFGVGLVLLAPVLYATAKKHSLSLLALGLPMVAGLSAAHGFVPPHPGPIAAIELIGADIGKTILYSLPVAALSAAVAGPILFRYVRLPAVQIPEPPASPSVADKPTFRITLFVILFPIILMTGSTLAELFLPPKTMSRELAALAGHPIVALLLGVLVAYAALGRGLSRAELLRISEDSLGPIAVIILIVGAGAGFSRVLIESGAGKAMAALAQEWRLTAVPMGFLIASLIRVATGSATVAITTAAGLVKPIADSQPGTNLELLVLAMGAGSLILSHVNDGGFWLVKSYLNLSVPECLRTWTVLETVLALTGFAAVLALDLLI